MIFNNLQTFNNTLTLIATVFNKFLTTRTYSILLTTIKVYPTGVKREA
jgi:hypothetical protein